MKVVWMLLIQQCKAISKHRRITEVVCRCAQLVLMSLNFKTFGNILDQGNKSYILSKYTHTENRYQESRQVIQRHSYLLLI